MEKRINAGYEIIESIELGGVEYVLGVQSKEQNQFVTWKSSPDRPDYYYWGHYTDSLLLAKKDLYERVIDEAKFLLQKVEEKLEHEANMKASEGKAKGKNRDMER